MLTRKIANSREWPTDIPAPKMPEGVSEKKRYFYYTAELLVQGDENFLVLSFWHQTGKLMCRAFFDKANGKYITHVHGHFKYTVNNQKYAYEALEKPIWSDAKLPYILLHEQSHYVKFERYATGSKGSAKLVTQYFGEGHKAALALVQSYQDDLAAAKLKQRNAAQRARVDEIMGYFHPLPKDWNRFVHNTALYKNRFLIYRRQRKAVKGYCTWCYGSVELEKGKHNSVVTCPHCGSQLTMKSQGIAGDYNASCRVAYVNNGPDGGLCVQVYMECWEYAKSAFYKPKLRYRYKDRRFYLPPGGNWVMYDWCNARWRQRRQVEIEPYFVYPYNLADTLRGGTFQYSAADVLAASGTPFCFQGWIYRYSTYPCLEYFPKIGLNTVSMQISIGDVPRHTQEYYGLNLEEKSIAKVMAYTKEELRFFAEVDASIEEMRDYREYLNKGYKLNTERLQLMRKLDIRPYKLLSDATDPGDDIPSTSPFKLLRYISKQVRKGYDFTRLLDLWSDYRRSAYTQGLPLDDPYYYFPPKLVQAHDALEADITLEKVEQFRAGFAERAELLASVRHMADGYVIFAPDIEELVKECIALHLCAANPAHGYMKAHIEGRKYLFVLHHANRPDAPYVLFQMDAVSGSIGQVSGKHNASISGLPKAFLQRWAKKLFQPFINRQKGAKRGDRAA